MKYYNDLKTKYCDGVAPLVGAWIEIVWMWLQYWMRMVAPLVGAWIEIFRKVIERDALIVAPLVGAWIEI